MITSTVIMADTIRITLRYRGKDVDNGTMSIEEVAEALSGLSGAYGKIAFQLDPESTHQLRLTGIDTHSFDLLVVASMLITDAGETLGKIKSIVDAVKHIAGILVDIVRAKKHTQNKPYSINVKGNNNTVVVVNADGAELTVPPEVIELMKSKLIDSDLRKISEPLEQDKIDAADLVIEEGTPDATGTTINAPEKDYFDLESGEATAKETEVTGKFVSLNKERNKGTFRLRNNQSVRYRFIGENKEKFHSDFSFEGPVKAKVIAEFNQDLTLVHLDIREVEPLQPRLALSLEPPSDKPK